MKSSYCICSSCNEHFVMVMMMMLSKIRVLIKSVEKKISKLINGSFFTATHSKENKSWDKYSSCAGVTR